MNSIIRDKKNKGAWEMDVQWVAMDNQIKKILV